MKIYLVTTGKGFGKGSSEAKAIEGYEKFNGELVGKYTLDIFEAKAKDDVSVDEFGRWHSVNYAKHLSSTESLAIV